MTRTPLVSIGLPTYNRAASLARAVDSVLTQDWGNLELVISDNASTDATQELCERLEREDSRVRYIRQPENRGAADNFLAARSEARGEFFMWLADDDWLDSGYVTECVRTLIEHEDHVLVCGRSRHFREGLFAYAERPVDLGQASSALRVLNFYRVVTMNGAFYGLVRRELVADQPFPDFDWAWTASLAYRGKLRTLARPYYNRSLEGESRDADALARALGLSPWQARNWHLHFARLAYRDILENPVYEPSSRLQRRSLAAGAWLLVAGRFAWKVWLGRLLMHVGLFDRARALLERRRRRRA